MGFFNRLWAPRAEPAPAQCFQVLTFGPSVLRMSVTGKDATTELDALAAAVAKLQYPPGMSTERVFASASELARMIRTDGVGGVTDRMRAELAPAARDDAIRLALTAVFCSPLRDPGDIGILARMAEHVGMSDTAFEALFDRAKAAA